MPSLEPEAYEPTVTRSTRPAWARVLGFVKDLSPWSRVEQNAKLALAPVSTAYEMSVEKDDQSVRLERGLARFRRSARLAALRRRVGLGVTAAARLAPFALLLIAPPLAVTKLHPGHGAEHWVVISVALGLTLLVGRGLWVALAKGAPLAGAIELDDFHATGGRIANALAFANVPPAERSPLMVLAIEDALSAVARLEPRRAVRVPIPRETPLVVLLLCGLAALSLVEVRTFRPLPPKPAPKPLLMSTDDVAFFRGAGEALAHATDDPTQQAAVARYNRLIEDVADHRVDEHEVFRRLAEIEADLGEHMEADREALDDGLQGVARELEKDPLTRKTAEALSEKRLDDAEKALRELSEKLKAKKNPPSAAELERLRSSLQQASEQSHARLEAIEQRRRELAEEREGLLKRKPDAASKDATQKKLDENKRQLEHLERQSSRAQKSAEQLSELDRELAKAAEDLQQALRERQQNAGEQPAEDLEQSAEDVHRMAQKQLDDAEKRELLQRLKEMREVLRQQGQGGEQRKQRLERFGQQARGQRPGGEEDGQPGKPGAGGVDIRMGRGEGIEIPGTQAGGQAQSAAGQGKDGSDSGESRPGPGFGNGHDAALTGDRTHLPAQTHDVSAAGTDSGEGTASAEVIYGAAQRGFVGKDYEQVFTEYQSVAERVLEKDEIPPGYRFYVRRYFQLIRPRE
jgi:hypothetical protein